MQPNPNGVDPQYSRPEFTPQGGQAPQWEQPQNVPQQLQPTQMQPPVPLNVQPPRQEIKPPEANASSFIPDTKTREILDRTYPEMTNALINLAIKKYSEDTDYANYFVREEFKAVTQQEQETTQTKETPEVKTENSFSSW